MVLTWVMLLLPYVAWVKPRNLTFPDNRCKGLCNGLWRLVATHTSAGMQTTYQLCTYMLQSETLNENGFLQLFFKSKSPLKTANVCEFHWWSIVLNDHVLSNKQGGLAMPQLWDEYLGPENPLPKFIAGFMNDITSVFYVIFFMTLKTPLFILHVYLCMCLYQVWCCPESVSDCRRVL